MCPPYAADLTRIHDEGFGALADDAARFLAEALGRDGRGRLVIELGCGGGITAAALSRDGYRVQGFDISPDQVELARERVREGTFEVSSIHDAELPGGASAVIAIGEIVNYAFDPRAGLDALIEMAGRAYAALEPGGLLLFDSAGPGRVPGGSTQAWREADDGSWLIAYGATERGDPPAVERTITTFVRTGDVWRRTDETHPLVLMEPEEIESALARVGFGVERRPGYDPGGKRFAPGLTVFAARKP